MAANILNAEDYDVIVARILGLTPQSQRQWGRMSSPQMLEHCAVQLKVAMGILPVAKTEGPSIYRTRPGRWIILYAFAWPKGAGTPGVMNMENNFVPEGDFEKKKVQLTDLLQEVKEAQTFHPHPFFGALGKKEWGRLIWKHLDHHLRQFNG